MKRMKRHKIKYEKQETSSSHSAVKEEHDLAYYIHDRVELMHQVFSVLKAKDLRAIAPECVRKLSIDDLEELCTEELLGISSKRLLAILDGAEPPSDTESSSQSSMEPMETISLDSISSDEELLSHGSKKKHKHKRRSSKSKKHKKKAEVEENNEETERSKASRAGLTVLELLELQARARAIRAQLQQEQANKKPEAAPDSSPESKSSDSEVEIKEEAAEVVEISSDDEKPKVEELEKALMKSKETNKEPEKSDKNAATNVINNDTNNTENIQANNKSKKKKEKSKKKNKRKDSEREEVIKEVREEVRDKNETTEVEDNGKISTTDKQTITKRVNDLIITVPQSSSRKIKLNRNKVTVSVNNDLQAQNNAADTTKKVVVPSTVTKAVNSADSANKLSSVISLPRNIENTVKSVVVETTTGKNVNVDKEKSKSKDKTKSKAKKAKKKQKRQSIDEDQDEITIQLSDSEKMDLLEDFDSKKYDRVSSSSEDSESSSESSDSDSSGQNSTTVENNINEGFSNKNYTIDNNTQSREVEGNVTDKTDEVNNKTDYEVNNKTSSSCSTNLEKDLYTVDESGNLDGSKGIEVTEIECCQKDKNNDNNKITVSGYVSLDNDEEREQQIEITNIDDIPFIEDAEVENNNARNDSVKNQDAVITPEINVKGTSNEIICVQNEQCENKEAEKSEQEITHKEQDKDVETTNNVLTKEMSEGELSSNESSEVEALEVRPEVISISDEETPKKKKKKEKKSKKEKASNFRERGDQNFYKETVKDNAEKNYSSKPDDGVKDIIVILDDDNVMEVYELSDDSSCYEVEGTVLSKEPTVEEIAALSAKIDEMEKEEADSRANQETVQIADENSSKCQAVIETEPLDENISWKDRYLGSAKVKTVLTTSNIFNVLRKKNKELKRKLEASKQEQKKTQLQPEEDVPKQPEILVEGSIEHYNTLQGSNKYVNPVPDPEELKEELAKKLREQEEVKRKEIEDQITGEMKKDAKQLLKMYKKLLKYNDVSKQKQKDPNKKKNKKRKKKEKEVATV